MMSVDQFQNAYVTKLRESCSVDADVLFVDTPPMITQGTLTIDFANQTKREIIHFTGVDGYKLTGVTRGLEDTTAQAHSIGTDIRQNVTAGMINMTNVGTDRIIDHAVTQDKIDFSTIKNCGSMMPFAKVTVPGPYNTEMKLERMGNIVRFFIGGHLSNAPAHTVYNEKVPVGFRPAAQHQAVNTMIREVNPNTDGVWEFAIASTGETSGKSLLLGPGEWVYGDTMYFTDNEWPS